MSQSKDFLWICCSTTILPHHKLESFVAALPVIFALRLEPPTCTDARGQNLRVEMGLQPTSGPATTWPSVRYMFVRGFAPKRTSNANT